MKILKGSLGLEVQRVVVPLCGTICLTHYNVKNFKGSYGRNESQCSLILNCKFCACVMQISGVPELQVIHMERLYGYK